MVYWYRDGDGLEQRERPALVSIEEVRTPFYVKQVAKHGQVIRLQQAPDEADRQGYHA